MKLDQFLNENKSKMNAIEIDFVTNVFFPYAGENGLDNLKVQSPFEDSQAKLRKLDFTIQSEKYKYVMEIDGYTYHAEGSQRVSPDYFDDLLIKQNDLILNGWKILRFSYNQVRNEPIFCIDTLRRAFKSDPVINPIFAGKKELKPTYPQIAALDSVEFFRNRGKDKGIVILPTGIGKTYFSAFDAKRLNGRTLFIVHRDTILQQAFDSFNNVWGTATKGFFNADEKDIESDVIFASKDTLYRDGNLQAFSADAFDYIIIDEAHHSSAKTYQKIIDYFTPKFLLGMTATPERQDRASILELFDYNIFFEMNLRDAIEAGYLTGYKYYGLKDDIDYTKIKHNGRRYDVADLGRKLNIDKRNQAIYNKFISICPTSKALGFCVSIEHAIRMADFFNERGISSKAIHSDQKLLPSAERKAHIQNFKDNHVQILFTVDVFNEGADFPDVEALLFLRPTESKTIFTQQLGRGLRLSPYKEHVTVLDFIGNFKKADNIPNYLSGGRSKEVNGDGPSTGSSKNRFGEKNFLDFPLGCEVYFEESVEELFSNMDQRQQEYTIEDLEENYFEVKEKIQRKPAVADINDSTVSKYKFSLYTKFFKSWPAFLESIGEATLASYHYPQGTTLGHIFYTIKSIGDKNIDDRLKVETIHPSSDAALSTLGRKSRFIIWACMELGLILDDREVGAKNEKTRYQNLTLEGQELYKILNTYVNDPTFYKFVSTSKTDVTWSMENNEVYYNNFIKQLPLVEKTKIKNIILKMDAVKHMLKFLFHINQNKETFNRSRDIYSCYFDTPFIKYYFEINGITQNSQEGASRRLPFILNLLESIEIIQFIDKSNIRIKELPMIEDLFIYENSNYESDIKVLEDFYTYNRLESNDEDIAMELRTLFGKDFLTDNYFIKKI